VLNFKASQPHEEALNDGMPEAAGAGTVLRSAASVAMSPAKV